MTFLGFRRSVIGSPIQLLGTYLSELKEVKKGIEDNENTFFARYKSALTLRNTAACMT